MKFKAISLLILLVTVFLLSTLAGVHLIGVSSAEGTYDWPMFHHDPRKSGYSSSTAPNTNLTLWDYSIEGGISSSPAVADGKVYIGSNNGVFYCLDATSGGFVWSYTTGSSISCSPAVAEGKVYIGSNDDNLYCLDAATGTQIWIYDTLGDIQSSPTVVDGRVYLGIYQSAYCLDAASGVAIWVHQNIASYDVVSSPAVIDGKVYVTTDGGYLHCLDASNGDRLWLSSGIYTQAFQSPAVVDGHVYVGTSRNFYCLDAGTGAQIWNSLIYQSGLAGSQSSPAVAYGKVYFGVNDGRLICLDAANGNLAWSYPIDEYSWSSPAVADNKVYIGSNDGILYCLDATSGDFIWSYLIGGSVVDCSPAIADGKVYMVSNDGRVYCFGVPSDTTPPTGSIVINGGAAYATSTDATLTLTHSDGGSGVDKVRYTNAYAWSTEPWETPVTSKSWTLTSGDGIKYVSYQVRDKAGLISETYYDTVTLDTTPPTGSIVINDGDASTSSASVTLTLTFADATSGVDRVRYTNNDVWGSEPWETPVTSRAWTLTSGAGTKYVSYQIRDNAGHISNYWDDINLEAAKVATPAISPSGGTYPTSQSVTLSCATSGATIRYTTNGSEPTASSSAYSSHIAVNSGTVTIKAKAFKTGMTDSDTATETYTIIPPDEDAPTTQHDYDGLLHINQLTITLTATDDNEVAETYYRINDGPILTVSAIGQPEIATQGENNKIEFWSADVTGNEESPHNVLTGIRLVIRDNPILIT
jgi:outer membrane protein assembly factor BamB